MPKRFIAIEQVLTLLRETPTRIAALTSDLSSEDTQVKPSSEEWSANEVLAHLRACADVWGNCIVRILDEERPMWRAINPRTWIKQTNYLNLPFRSSLDAFTTQRADLLALLSPLSTDGWSRTAIVTGAGKVLEPTVLSYAERLSIHERSHVKQIQRLVKTKQG